MSGRIAVLADIHGNAWALGAVLRDARAAGATRILNLGDIFWGPLDPRGTWELLCREPGALSVAGNQDRQTLEAPAGGPQDPGGAAHEWLAALPATAVDPDGILLCHGSPGSDTEYLLEDVGSGRACPRPADAIAGALAGIPQPLIVCGHTHVPRLVEFAPGRYAVNPGSVGLQAYTDDLPVPHAIETGAPHASYGILDRAGDAWNVTFRRVVYDWHAASRAAAAGGRPDWAYALETGWAWRGDDRGSEKAASS
jgi:diadenosine tetraphosphatase ApaH/serine/threonine PP2A family protein phosphatase